MRSLLIRILSKLVIARVKLPNRSQWKSVSYSSNIRIREVGVVVKEEDNERPIQNSPANGPLVLGDGLSVQRWTGPANPGGRFNQSWDDSGGPARTWNQSDGDHPVNWWYPPAWWRLLWWPAREWLCFRPNVWTRQGRPIGKWYHHR